MEIRIVSFLDNWLRKKIESSAYVKALVAHIEALENSVIPRHIADVQAELKSIEERERLGVSHYFDAIEEMKAAIERMSNAIDIEKVKSAGKFQSRFENMDASFKLAVSSYDKLTDVVNGIAERINALEKRRGKAPRPTRKTAKPAKRKATKK